MLTKIRLGALAVLVLTGLISAVGFLAGHAVPEEQGPAAEPEAMLARIPLAFVENRGQWPAPVKFRARWGGMVAHLEGDALTLQLERRESGGQVKGVVVRMAFEGASKNVTLEGEAELPGTHNFFLGSDPSRWRTEVPGYARVVYRSLYDGVDVRLREDGGELEYDLLLAEAADLSQVVVRCDGTGGLKADSDGSLLMETELGSIRQRPPTSWYELPSGEQAPVECKYRILDANRYGFEVPREGLSLALVIDPALEWSTYFGGSDEEAAGAVALGPSGAVVMGGYTESVDSIATPGAYDTTYNGFLD